MRSYTKEFMVDALKKLLKIKPLNKITVNDIVTECGASKQTFYNHFQDKFDLFSYALTAVLEQNLTDSALNASDFTTLVQNYLCRVLEEKDFYRSFIRDDASRTHISQCLELFCAEYFRENVRTALNCHEIPQEFELSIVFDAVGNAKLVTEWIYSGMTTSPETLAGVISRCVPESIREFHNV